jgi:hypothetical protein
MNWWFAFAFAAGIGILFINFSNVYAGFFIVGGAFGAGLYKLLEDRK